MRAGMMTVLTVALPTLAGCQAKKPEWLSQEGWLAARCEAAAETSAKSVGESRRAAVETWRDLSGAFSATTDQRMETRRRASLSLSSVSAETFFNDHCGDDAIADVRRVM